MKKVCFRLLAALLALALLPALPLTFAGAEETAVEETVDYEKTYASLYVKDGLTVFLDAFSTDLVDLSSGRWKSRVGDAVATLSGGTYSEGNPTGWLAREKGGIGWDQLIAAGSAISYKSNGVYLPTSYIPEGSFTAEFVAATDGVTQKDQDGSVIHYLASYDPATQQGAQYGHTVSDCYAIGVVRTTSWLTDVRNTDDTSNTNDVGHRYFFTGMNYNQHYTSFGSKAAAGMGIGEDHIALNSAVGFINTTTWTLERSEDGTAAAFRQYNGTSASARNAADITVENCKNQSSITTLPANNAGYTNTGAADPSAVKLQFAVGMAGTLYSIRLYNRVLSYEERLQNHFADLVACFGLRAGCFADVDVSVRRPLYEKYAATDFTADAETRAALQADIDDAVATVDVALYGYQAGKDGTSLRIWGGMRNLDLYSSVGISIYVKESSRTLEGSTQTVYQSFTGTDAQGRHFTVTAEGLGTDALFAAVLTGITAGTHTLTFTPFAVTKEGDRVTGASKTVSFTVEEPKEAEDLLDWVITVEEGREARVLLLSDTQIIDAAQRRTPDRLSAGEITAYDPTQMENRVFTYIRNAVNNTFKDEDGEFVKPDLILIAGDITYGSFDDAGTSLEALIAHMESYEIPWAPVYGNHENESAKGVLWQNAQLEAAEYCLFKTGTVTGNGNYTVGITQGGELLRVFYMMDSGGCSGASAASLPYVKTTQGFAQDQIDWMADIMEAVNEAAGKTVPSSLVFHIPTTDFAKAAEKTYGNEGAYMIRRDVDAQNGDFGARAATVTGFEATGKGDISFAELIKSLGTDSLFVGHVHENNTSILYDGIRFTFGLKTGEYDSHHAKQVGGTALLLTDGEITVKHSYQDKSYQEEMESLTYTPPIEIDGVQMMDYLAGDTAWSKANLGGVGCYKVDGIADNFPSIKTSASEKNAALLRGVKYLVFDVYIPSSHKDALFNGSGAFTIRAISAAKNEYIWYNLSSRGAGANAILAADQWQTVVVDLSAYGGELTELGFYTGDGTLCYVKNFTLCESNEISGLPYLEYCTGSTYAWDTVLKDGEWCYMVDASSARIDTIIKASDSAEKAALLENVRLVKMSVYLPSGYSGVFDAGYPFFLRVKGVSTNKYLGRNDLPTDEWVDITIDLSSYKGDVNQLGIYVPEDRVAYFKNFELVGIGGVALDFTKALTTNSTPASMAVVQMGGEWCYKYGYSDVRTELGFDATKNETAAALLDGKTTLTFDLYMTSGSDALLNGSGLFTIRPKSASSNGYIWYNAKDSGKTNAVIVYDEWQTVTVDLSQYGGDLTFLGIYFQNTVYLKNITLS